MSNRRGIHNMTGLFMDVKQPPKRFQTRFGGCSILFLKVSLSTGRKIG